MPDHSNAATRQTEERMGPFVYDDDESIYNDVIDRGPFELDNGSIYHG